MGTVKTQQRANMELLWADTNALTRLESSINVRGIRKNEHRKIRKGDVET